MTVTVDEYRLLKKKVEDWKAKTDRAEGAFTEAMKRLAALGHDDISKAEEGLKKLRAELVTAEEGYEEELGKFREKWEDVLE